MNQQLCDSIGHTFYSEQPGSYLVPSTDSSVRKFPGEPQDFANDALLREALAPDHSLVWLKVPAKNITQLNLREAEIAAKLVSICLKSGIDKDNIAVVTPFRRQVMQIRHFVRREVGEEIDLPIIDTVERVQGLTVEMVIVSLCASTREYVESMAEFLFSPNRLNVAVSRSRTKSIVISHPDIFDCLPRTFNGLEARNICQNLLNSELSWQIDSPIDKKG